MQDSKSKDVEHIVILSGDHLYRMDYMSFVQVSLYLHLVLLNSHTLHKLFGKFLIYFPAFYQKHIDTNADITVSCIPMDDRYACNISSVLRMLPFLSSMITYMEK